MRLVFDGSLKTRWGQSLNQCLYRGPPMVPDLVGVLLRFRKSHFVMLADIEKAFLQVGLNKSDREVTRFLWVKDVNLPPEGKNLVVLRYCRVLFGLVSSPFLLAAVLEYHLKKSKSPIAEKLKENLYVDNLLLTSNNLDEAKIWYCETKAIFKEAQMNLREFFCNVEDIQNEIPEGDRQTGPFVSVLGLNWDTKEDKILMKTKGWVSERVTKD